MDVQERSFRGHPYKISCDTSHPGYQHPSWFSFDDEATVRDAKWLIEPGDCILDVGAAYGSYALSALAAGAAFVFAWSPQGPPGEPTEREMMLQSLKLNGWEDRAVIYASGCYSRSGWVNASTQEFHTTEPAPQGDIIRVDSLDDWFRTEFSPRFSPGAFPRYWMKLDVEGAEVEVLKGAEVTIRTLKPSIVVENHNFKRASLEQEVRSVLIDQFGYREVATTPYHAVSHSLYQR